MITLEQVEKLCERANVTYDEAKAALEATNGDLLEALINLERQGKAKAPKGGGQYVSAEVVEPQQDGRRHSNGASDKKTYKTYDGTSFGELVGRFIRFCGRIINKGNINNFVVTKAGEAVIKLPITAMVLLLILAFWVVIPLLIIGLFFGYRYFFNGPDFEGTGVNKAMDSVADAAENLKNGVNKEADKH